MKDERENGRERYFWDLTGYLVVHGVLSSGEIAAANAVIVSLLGHITMGEQGTGDSRFLKGTGARWYRGQNLLNLPQPHCEVFRDLLVHPAVVSRLN